MQRLPKAQGILALTFAVFAFSIYCCCFIHSAQAREQTPSCHQAGHQKNQSHDSQECDCQKNIVAYPHIEKKFNKDLGQSAFLMTFTRISLGWPIPTQLSNRTSSESPPFSDSTVLLYIQHSTLRI
jgi:hypothetical protein